MRAALRTAAVAAACLLVATGAAAQSTADPENLVDLINAWRASAHDCDGHRVASSPRLAANPTLASATVAASERPIDVLKARGYLAAHVETVFVTGPSRAADVMRFLEQRYCRTLSSPEVTEIGVAHDARTWHLVLARPLLAPDLGDWRHAGLEVLKATNAARASARACGARRFPAAPPVAWNDHLAVSALAHSEDMASRDDLTHAGIDGSNSGDRATRAGYLWQAIGENIASGQGSARDAVDAWLSSPEHCSTLMDRRFSEMGAAYAIRPGSRGAIYWAQEFGAPREGAPR